MYMVNVYRRTYNSTKSPNCRVFLTFLRLITVDSHQDTINSRKVGSDVQRQC